MQTLIIAGASGHARLVIDAVEQASSYRIVGLIDSFRPPGTACMGYRVLGSIEDLPRLVPEHKVDAAFVGIGDNWMRNKVAERIRLLAPHLSFANVRHPSCHIAPSVVLGEGNLFMAASIVNPAASIGNFCSIGTNASIDHDTVMEDYASAAPGVITGGNVTVGTYTALGLGARVIHGIRIGPHTVIGAGATVVRDIPAQVVACGIPARVTRNRLQGERYL